MIKIIRKILEFSEFSFGGWGRQKLFKIQAAMTYTHRTLLNPTHIIIIPNNPMQLISRFFQKLERQEREARHERKEARQERREDSHRRERQHRDDMKRRSWETEQLIRAIQAGRGSPTHKYGTIDSQIHTRRLWTRLCGNATWPA